YLVVNVYLLICVCLCAYVCLCESVCVSICVCAYVSVCRVYVCLCEGVCASICVCECVCVCEAVGLLMCEIPYVFLSVKLTGALAEAERGEHTCLRFHTLITPLQLGVYPSVHRADI